MTNFPEENNLHNYTHMFEFLRKIPCSIYWKDLNGVYLGCNEFIVKISGLYSIKEIIGKTDYNLPWFESADLLRAIDQQVMKTGQPVTIEETGKLSCGKLATYLSTKMPLRNDLGEIIGVFGISIDISAYKQKEKNLKIEKENAEAINRARFEFIADLNKRVTGQINTKYSAEEYAKNMLTYLENIIACMPGNIYWMDTNCVYLGCNNNSARLMGLRSRKDVIGKTYAELAQTACWYQGQADSFKRDDLEVMTTGMPKYNIEEPPVLSPEGSKIYFLTTRVPIFDKEGNIIGVVGNSIDITDRKLMEQELKQSKEKTELANKAVTIFAKSMAHELRTPLASLNGYMYGINKYLPILIKGYQLAKENNLPVDNIRPEHYEAIIAANHNMEAEINHANAIIDMILFRANPEELKQDNLKVCSIATCIQEALLRYPFKSAEEKRLIKWDKTQDFLFLGEQLFTIHILFNLLKNALFYIAKENKGEVFIHAELGNEYNLLYFRDTSKGIAADILPNIFNLYFSDTPHGTGVGLAFCKQVMAIFSGDIECRSEEGKYAEFILKFPVLSV